MVCLYLAKGAKCQTRTKHNDKEKKEEHIFRYLMLFPCYPPALAVFCGFSATGRPRRHALMQK